MKVIKDIKNMKVHAIPLSLSFVWFLIAILKF